MRAIRRASKGSILYVARVLQNNTWAMAKPCLNCQTAIKAKKIERVYYTIGPGEFGVWYPNKRIDK
jgi:deoxycytidylate deaminase